MCGMKINAMTVAVAAGVALGAWADDVGIDPTRHWSFAELEKAPSYRASPYPETEWQGLKAMLVKGKGPNGAEAEFFCYYGHPDGPTPKGGFPGVVLVHGGGGTAYPNHVENWVKLGFAVIAPDWYNQCPAPGITNAPPPAKKSRESLARIQLQGGKRQDHAANVANMVLAHSLLRSFPEVDASRTVFVGLSWGSWYGTCVAAVDGRFRGCVEIYCGDLNPGRRSRDALVDGRFLRAAKVPMWWTVSTNDRNVTPATSQAGFDACARFAGAAIVNDLPHSHIGFTFASVQRMARHFAGMAKPLPRLADARIADGMASARIADPGEGVAHAVLGYTTDSDPVTWKRKWLHVPAAVEGGRITARVPEGTVQCYLAAYETAGTDRRSGLCGTTGILTP